MKLDIEGGIFFSSDAKVAIGSRNRIKSKPETFLFGWNENEKFREPFFF